MIDDTTTPPKIIAELTTDTKEGVFALANNDFDFDFQVGTTLTILHANFAVGRNSEQIILIVSDNVQDSTTGAYTTNWTNMTFIQ